MQSDGERLCKIEATMALERRQVIVRGEAATASAAVEARTEFWERKGVALEVVRL